MIDRLLYLIQKASWADRAVYGAVVATVVFALFSSWIWGSMNPAIPLSDDFYDGEALDPWTNFWVKGRIKPDDGQGPWRIAMYSRGPNGVDQHGQGDDVVILPADSSWLSLYRNGTELLLILAMAAAGGWEVMRFVRSQMRKPRAETLLPELRRSAFVAVPIAVGLAIVCALTLWAWDEAADDTKKKGAARPTDAIEERLLVPLPVAVAGSAYLATFCVVLSLRLRRPLSEPDGAEES